MPGVGETGQISSSHEGRYKNKGVTQDELRRRREEDSIQLRKQKRDDQITKRRNVTLEPGDLSDVDGTDETQPQARLRVFFYLSSVIVKLYYSLGS